LSVSAAEQKKAVDFYLSIHGKDEVVRGFQKVGTQSLMLGFQMNSMIRLLGLQDTALGKMVDSYFFVARGIRAVTTAYQMYKSVSGLIVLVNKMLTGSFIALNIASGGILLALGAIAGVGLGLALSGTMGGGGTTGATQAVEPGSNVYINVNRADFSSRAEAEKTVEETGTLFRDMTKRYGP